MRAGSCFRPVLTALLLLSLSGCRLPGRPMDGSVAPRPDQVASFDVLYRTNCQACHGVNGHGGMAISLANPAYIAYAGSDHIRQITANGIGGSLMPGFSVQGGGLLTEQQVTILADGIVSHWANASALHGAAPPVYESQASGNAEAGADLYRTACLRCHAPGHSSILDPTYLALVSNGGLRTWIVAGAPERGMPNWRGYPGPPLTDPQITDLVAFLVRHRTPAPGQPYSNAAGAVTESGGGTDASTRQSIAAAAGPATGGPASSQSSAPAPTPVRPVSPRP